MSTHQPARVASTGLGGGNDKKGGPLPPTKRKTQTQNQMRPQKNNTGPGIPAAPLPRPPVSRPVVHLIREQSFTWGCLMSGLGNFVELAGSLSSLQWTRATKRHFESGAKAEVVPASKEAHTWRYTTRCPSYCPTCFIHREETQSRGTICF